VKKGMVQELIRSDEAQDLIEYSLLLAFVALAGAAMFVGMSNTSAGIWTTVNSRLANAANGGS
jgi:Flp pilus assembly pilin Flp